MVGIVGIPSSVSAQLAESETSTTELLPNHEEPSVWKTSGGNTLDSIPQSKFESVIQGETGLGVAVDGDPHPMIENKKSVKNADFTNRPYLVADVFAANLSGDSSLTFQFEYHHNGGSGSSKGGKKGKKKSNARGVVSSDQFEVQQGEVTTLYWDMRSISAQARKHPKRLTISWYPTEHPPERKGEGRGNARSYEYRGIAIFGEMFLSADASEIVKRVVPQRVRKHELERGSFTGLTTIDRTDSSESGLLEFDDGSSIEYQFEILGDQQYRYTIDGQSFEFGGGLG